MPTRRRTPRGRHPALTAVPEPARRANPADPAAWLASASDDILICRGQRHKIPVLDPRETTDAIVDIKDGGVVHITFTCERCGAHVSLETLEDGIYDRRHVKRSYGGYPEGYRAPREVTPTACFQETIRRTREARQAIA